MVDSSLVRAIDSSVDDLVSQINTYRKAYIGSSALDLENIKSVTYNDITDRLSGEEVSDYTQNYNSQGTVTTTAINFYDGALFPALTGNEFLQLLVDNELTGVLNIDNLKAIINEQSPDFHYDAVNAYQNILTILTDREPTVFTSAVIDQINTLNIHTIRAEYADSESLLSQINTYRQTLAAPIDTISYTDLDDIKSITYNDITDRLSGEEVSDYTQNYNSLGDETTVSVNFYKIGTELKRAMESSVDDLTAQINTFRSL